MKLFHDYEAMAGMDTSAGRVVTIGNFDGVHLGHQAVIGKSMEVAAAAGLDFAICTFEPHPAELFAREPRMRLCTPEDKYALLAQHGVEVVLAQEFTAAFAAIAPRAFAQRVLVAALKARKVIVGEDFRFGNNREGTVQDLRAWGAQLGFEVVGEPLVTREGEPISSSRIRAHLQAGEVAAAAALLGRPHAVPGEVVPGFREGRAMGFPTVNLQSPNVLIPGDGIYAAWCTLEDGTRCRSAVYAGERPTLGHGRSLEAHLIDFHGDLYGTRVQVQFAERLRDDQKFDSPEALRAQIEKDVAQVNRVLSEGGRGGHPL